MIRYKMFEREITSGDHRSYHVCVNNFGSNFKSKSKFHPIDEALSKIDEDFTDYECNITLQIILLQMITFIYHILLRIFIHHIFKKMF